MLGLYCNHNQWRIYPLAKSTMAPLPEFFYFDILRNCKFCLPLCVSNSSQQTFAPVLKS